MFWVYICSKLWFTKMRKVYKTNETLKLFQVTWGMFWCSGKMQAHKYHAFNLSAIKRHICLFNITSLGYSSIILSWKVHPNETSAVSNLLQVLSTLSWNKTNIFTDKWTIYFIFIFSCLSYAQFSVQPFTSRVDSRTRFISFFFPLRTILLKSKYLSFLLAVLDENLWMGSSNY